MMENDSNLDYNKMCQVVNKCENLYESQLKDIRVIQRLKADIEDTKKNFYVRMRTQTIDKLVLFTGLLLKQRVEELENAKYSSIKNLQDALLNRTFQGSGELSSKIGETVKENLKAVGLDHVR